MSLRDYVFRLVEIFARREQKAKQNGDVKDAARQREIIDTILREYRAQSLEPEE